MAGPAYVSMVLKLLDREPADIHKRLRQTSATTNAARYHKRRVINGIQDLLTGALGNAVPANLFVGVSGDHATKPSWAIACTQANAATDTVTITVGGAAIVFTEASSDAVLGFARGASNTTCGDNLAAKINAHPVLGGLYVAVAVTGTITLTSRLPQHIMPATTVATSDATAFGITPTAGTAGTAALQFQAIQLGRSL